VPESELIGKLHRAKTSQLNRLSQLALTMGFFAFRERTGQLV